MTDTAPLPDPEISGMMHPATGKWRCMDGCGRLVEYTDLAHLDWYADVQWLQCFDCARAHGERCAANPEWQPAR
jgi:hypothetical protein